MGRYHERMEDDVQELEGPADASTGPQAMNTLKRPGTWIWHTKK